jgi:hypothetical protein
LGIIAKSEAYDHPKVFEKTLNSRFPYEYVKDPIRMLVGQPEIELDDAAGIEHHLVGLPLESRKLSLELLVLMRRC